MIEKIRRWLKTFPTIYESDREVHKYMNFLLSENERLQDHADKLGEIITNQTIKRLALEARIKELEAALDITTGALEGSQGVVRELEDYASKLIDESITFYTEKCKAEVRVKKLEDGIEGILNQKDLISFTIQKQLEELLGKEKP